MVKKKEKVIRVTETDCFSREAGITSWNLEQKPQSMSFWGNALKFTNYHFEHRLTMVKKVVC